MSDVSQPLVVVISNVFNFLAEKVMEEIDGDVLVVHVGKTPDQIRAFRGACENMVIDRPALHGAVLDHLMFGRLKKTPLALFVDHDVIFAPGSFQKLRQVLVEEAERSPEAYIIAQRHEPHARMLCNYRFRTVPMFMARPFMTRRCNSLGWFQDDRNDTGQRIANAHPDLLALVDEFVPYNDKNLRYDIFTAEDGWPFTHWTSGWMNQHPGSVAIWQPRVMKLMSSYDEIDPSDVARMRAFDAFRDWLQASHA